VLFIAVPLAVGILIRLAAEEVAERSHPIVKKVTGIDTLIMLGLIVIIYGRDFASAVGTFAIGTLILFCVIAAGASYSLGFGMPPAQKKCTRPRTLHAQHRRSHRTVYGCGWHGPTGDCDVRVGCTHHRHLCGDVGEAPRSAQ
jgi:hypothetical protein